MLGFLIGEAVRDLRRAGRVAVSAIVLITLSLAALGGFWLLSLNLERAMAQWRERVRIIVYLKREPASREAQALVARVQAVPGVAGVLYISKADALASRLCALGAQVIELPTIEIHPPADPAPLDRAIAELPSYDWLIFTSANGVRFFMERLAALV